MLKLKFILFSAGYIVLKRQQLDHRQSPGGGQHTLDHSSQSPVGLHEESRHFTIDQTTRSPASPNKYFSVKGTNYQFHKIDY